MACRTPDRVSGVEYQIEYRWFRDALQAGTSEPCRQLAFERDQKLPTRIDLPLAVTLRHHSCFANTYYRGVFPKFYKGSREYEVNKFFERDGKDEQFSLGVQQRLMVSERFIRYMAENGLTPSRRCRERQEPSEPPISDLGDTTEYCFSRRCLSSWSCSRSSSDTLSRSPSSFSSSPSHNSSSSSASSISSLISVIFFCAFVADSSILSVSPPPLLSLDREALCDIIFRRSELTLATRPFCVSSSPFNFSIDSWFLFDRLLLVRRYHLDLDVDLRDLFQSVFEGCHCDEVVSSELGTVSSILNRTS
ncbi:hypothetical protein B0T25DRAFT_66552 [Lasiosphaeria hispida]|uniref:Uncharacterized protein n=1 Tax=Lasiosphaeria hispida TaxID=260671 RepID=A0AAJ0ML45_9PEZI|nr:hypothetical protein B0T25DRAFT_66552 [Lasiosphaeria hispida]